MRQACLMLPISLILTVACFQTDSDHLDAAPLDSATVDGLPWDAGMVDAFFDASIDAAPSDVAVDAGPCNETPYRHCDDVCPGEIIEPWPNVEQPDYWICRPSYCRCLM